jgi:hypothetical protein
MISRLQKSFLNSQFSNNILKVIEGSQFLKEVKKVLKIQKDLKKSLERR